MRFLVAALPQAGHIVPIANVVRRLVDEGRHQIAWASNIPRSMRSIHDRQDVVIMEEIRSWGVELLDWNLTPPAWYVDELADPTLTTDAIHYRQRQVRATVESMPAPVERAVDVIRRYRPDVLVLDAAAGAFLMAAEIERARFAVISTNLEPAVPESLSATNAPLDAATTARVMAGVNRWREHFNLAPLRGSRFFPTSPWLNVVFTTEEFLGRNLELAPHTVVVGPSMPKRAESGDRGGGRDFPWDAVGVDRPVVFVAYGSQIYADVARYQAIAAAAASLGIQLVIAAGDLVRRGTLRDLPGDVVLVPYAPQFQLLERVTAFVTHGGAGSVHEALYQGVPMLVDPLCFDQPMQARLVEDSGVGLSMQGRSLDVEAWRHALLAVVDPKGSYRERASAVRASYRRRDGALEAARLLQVPPGTA